MSLRSFEAAILLLAASASLANSADIAGCGRNKVGLTRIVGGTIAGRGQWPWQVSITEVSTTVFGSTSSHFCGGILISNQFVLTAAHCFYGKNLTPTRFLIVLGDHNQQVEEGTELRIYASQIIMHPQYIHNGQLNDIALVRLSQPINLSAYPFINVACLPQATDSFYSNGKCYSTGWGLTRGPQDSTILQMVNSIVIPFSVCRGYFNTVTDNTKICFGNGARGACMGDSGGPLSCPRSDGAYVAAGIVSFGTLSCTQQPYPTVYTNVAAYRGWIQTYTGL